MLPLQALDALGSGSHLLYAMVANAATLTNTTAATVVGTFTVDGAGLRVGDVLHVRASGTCPSTDSTDTLTVALSLGTESIATTGAVDVANADQFHLDFYIVIRAIGASGAVAGCGFVVLDSTTTVLTKAVKAQATEDISGNVALALTGTWSVAAAANQFILDNFIVELLRK